MSDVSLEVGRDRFEFGPGQAGISFNSAMDEDEFQLIESTFGEDFEKVIYFMNLLSHKRHLLVRF